MARGRRWRTSTKGSSRSRFPRGTPGTVAQEVHLVETYLVKMECYFETFKSEDEEGGIQLRTCILMGQCKSVPRQFSLNSTHANMDHNWVCKDCCPIVKEGQCV